MDKYVLGFLMCETESGEDNVVLVVKKKFGPEFNIGKFNGIGGKIEEGEGPISAMRRECREEAGVETYWTKFALLQGVSWEVHVFSAYNTEIIDIDEGRDRSVNDVGEETGWISVNEAIQNPDIMAQNVPTLLTHVISGEGFLTLEVM